LAEGLVCLAVRLRARLIDLPQSGERGLRYRFKDRADVLLLLGLVIPSTRWKDASARPRNASSMFLSSFIVALAVQCAAIYAGAWSRQIKPSAKISTRTSMSFKPPR